MTQDRIPAVNPQTVMRATLNLGVNVKWLVVTLIRRIDRVPTRCIWKRVRQWHRSLLFRGASPGRLRGPREEGGGGAYADHVDQKTIDHDG